MSIPRWIRRREPKLVQIGPAVWQLPQTKTPQVPPLCLEGQFVWRISIPRWICRCVPNLVTASPNFWICDTLSPPLEMPPGVLRGDLYLAYGHSQMNPQTWTKGGANRTASPYFWIVDPLKPPKCPPCVSRGNLFGVYPFPHEFAHVCQIWCQSAQPFGSFSRICAKVSSAFRRCTRWLAQKHSKKQHLYIKNYNSGPNMQTSTSLTFFTAIFVAFSGVNDILPACKNWIIYSSTCLGRPPSWAATCRVRPR